MDALTRFLMDPLVKPEDDKREEKPEDEERAVWFYCENTIYENFFSYCFMKCGDRFKK